MVIGFSPGMLQHLKIDQQRNSQPKRAEKKPSVRQNIKQEKLRKKKFSRCSNWFSLSNASERSSSMNRNQVITRTGPSASWEESCWSRFQLSEDRSQIKKR